MQNTYEESHDPSLSINPLLGAIIGDIAGSTHEFDEIKKISQTLFPEGSNITDDTILTMATAHALLTAGEAPGKKPDYARAYWQFATRYPTPKGSYGGMFSEWYRKSESLGSPAPAYDSFGNGAAMRVSPVAYAFDTLEEVLAEAKRSAECTHNHSEGIKGAQAVAAAIFLSRQAGTGKEEIRRYISENFAYNLNRTIKEIRPGYRWDGTCQGTVPEAIIAFLDSKDFSDALKLAISLGGDADTLAAITGSIAAAFYKKSSHPGNLSAIRVSTARTAWELLPEEFQKIYALFTEKYISRLSHADFDKIDSFCAACAGIGNFDNETLQKTLKQFDEVSAFALDEFTPANAPASWQRVHEKLCNALQTHKLEFDPDPWEEENPAPSKCARAEKTTTHLEQLSGKIPSAGNPDEWLSWQKKYVWALKYNPAGDTYSRGIFLYKKTPTAENQITYFWQNKTDRALRRLTPHSINEKHLYAFECVGKRYLENLLERINYSEKPQQEFHISAFEKFHRQVCDFYDRATPRDAGEEEDAWHFRLARLFYSALHLLSESHWYLRPGVTIVRPWNELIEKRHKALVDFYREKSKNSPEAKANLQELVYYNTDSAQFDPEAHRRELDKEKNTSKTLPRFFIYSIKKAKYSSFFEDLFIIQQHVNKINGVKKDDSFIKEHGFSDNNPCKFFTAKHARLLINEQIDFAANLSEPEKTTTQFKIKQAAGCLIQRMCFEATGKSYEIRRDALNLILKREVMKILSTARELAQFLEPEEMSLALSIAGEYCDNISETEKCYKEALTLLPESSRFGKGFINLKLSEITTGERQIDHVLKAIKSFLKFKKDENSPERYWFYIKSLYRYVDMINFRFEFRKAQVTGRIEKQLQFLVEDDDSYNTDLQLVSAQFESAHE